MANYTEKELANVPAEELIEIIMELQSDIDNLKTEMEIAKSEQNDAEDKAEKLQDELDGFIEVDLGSMYCGTNLIIAAYSWCKSLSNSRSAN